MNLMEGALVAVDGERDPRCLLLGFQSIRELCCLYAEHDLEVSPQLRISPFFPHRALASPCHAALLGGMGSQLLWWACRR